MTLMFTDDGWRTYQQWVGDVRTLKHIHKLIADISRNGHDGIGKPEPLSGEWSGWWGRRIDAKNRLVYRIADEGVEIAQCGGHYSSH